jgi:hypothetical protein
MDSRLLSVLTKNAATGFFILILTASLSLNLMLGMKYRNLVSPRPSGITTGAEILTIPVLDKTGAKSSIKLHGSPVPTVLYVLSPACVWCARNLDNIRRLADQRSNAYHFIGLSITSVNLTEYLQSTKLPFDVSVVDQSTLPKTIRFDSTPQMILINSTGRVSKVWTGALDGDRKTQAEEFFHLKLPGLPAAGAAAKIL